MVYFGEVAAKVMGICGSAGEVSTGVMPHVGRNDYEAGKLIDLRLGSTLIL